MATFKTIVLSSLLVGFIASAAEPNFALKDFNKKAPSPEYYLRLLFNPLQLALEKLYRAHPFEESLPRLVIYKDDVTACGSIMYVIEAFSVGDQNRLSEGLKISSCSEVLSVLEVRRTGNNLKPSKTEDLLRGFFSLPKDEDSWEFRSTASGTLISWQKNGSMTKFEVNANFSNGNNLVLKIHESHKDQFVQRNYQINDFLLIASLRQNLNDEQSNSLQSYLSGNSIVSFASFSQTLKNNFDMIFMGLSSYFLGLPFSY